MDKKQPTSEKPEPLPLEEEVDDMTSQIVAYLDGELDSQDAEELELKINRDAKLRTKVQELKQSWALLDFLPKPEPSPHFTERTMEKIEPIPENEPKSKTAKTVARGTMQSPALKSGTPPAQSPATNEPGKRAPKPPSTGRGFIMLILGVVLATSATAGYFLRAAVVKPPVAVQPSAEPKIEDAHLLRNLKMYQHVNDANFMKELDHPDLFGDAPANP